MKALFKYLLVCAGLLLSTLWLSTASAMPSYARQTGMDCNSCHIGYSGNPFFTRTGRLFIMKGFHQPGSVRGHISQTGFDAEGNDTPEYGGNYLSENWQDFWAWRMSTNILSGGDNPATQTNSASPSRISMFFTGPITDWLGLWSEVGYLANNQLPAASGPGAGNATNLNLFALDEFRLTASKDLGNDSFIAVATGNEGPDSINEMLFPLGLVRPFGGGEGVVGKEYSTTTYSFYGFFDNHYYIQFSPMTGDYDNSWSNGWNKYLNFDYNGIPGYGDQFNRESMDVWWEFTGMWGPNFMSMIHTTPSNLICSTNPCPAGINGTGFSISPGNGNNVPTISDITTFDPVTASQSPSSAYGYRIALHNAAADWGNHSWYGAVDVAVEHQGFPSGARATFEGFGSDLRYFYNRTYGFEFTWEHPFAYHYWAPTTTEYKVTTQANTWGLTLLWVPAENMTFSAGWSPATKSTVINTTKQTQGFNSWSMGLDMGF